MFGNVDGQICRYLHSSLFISEIFKELEYFHLLLQSDKLDEYPCQTQYGILLKSFKISRSIFDSQQLSHHKAAARSSTYCKTRTVCRDFENVPNPCSNQSQLRRTTMEKPALQRTTPYRLSTALVPPYRHYRFPVFPKGLSQLVISMPRPIRQAFKTAINYASETCQPQAMST